MGLKRINFDELPDQYVELQKEALPLPSDPPQVGNTQTLGQLIKSG